MDASKRHRRRLIPSAKGLQPAKGLPSADLSLDEQQWAALRETLAALEAVMALYGRLRLAPYPYEHMVWRTARKALLEGKKVLAASELN